MKTISVLALTLLAACSGVDASGTSPEEAAGGSTTTTPTESVSTASAVTASGGSTQVAITTAPVAVVQPLPVPVCVPGSAASCACTNGLGGAQTCDATGKYAACVCTVVATPEPVTVAPAGYSGACVSVGIAIANGAGAVCISSNPYLKINCTGKLELASDCLYAANGIPGLWCCARP